LCGRCNVRPAAGVCSLQTPRSNHRKMKRRNGAGANQNVSVIASGARIVGDVHTSGVIQVAGSVVGNIRAECKVLVAKGGMVDGDIESREAVVGGEVRGRVLATERVAVQAATLDGTITTPRLSVEEGAIMDVELCMSESGALLDLPSDTRKPPAARAMTYEDERVEVLKVGDLTA